MHPRDSDFTQTDGSQGIALPEVYDRLRGLAGALLRRERPDHTLEATALVHEAWLRLAAAEDLAPTSREHFVQLAARAMRRLLVDHARARSARPSGARAPATRLDGVLADLGASADDLLSIDEVLGEMAESEPELARLVELRFFAGLGHGEIAELIGSTPRRVELSWTVARAWLRRRLRAFEPDLP